MIELLLDERLMLLTSVDNRSEGCALAIEVPDGVAVLLRPSGKGDGTTGHRHPLLTVDALSEDLPREIAEALALDAGSFELVTTGLNAGILSVDGEMFFEKVADSVQNGVTKVTLSASNASEWGIRL